MTTECDFVFEGRWADGKHTYVVRPGADVDRVRRRWSDDAAASMRPRWQRRVRLLSLVALVIGPLVAAILVSIRLSPSAGDFSFLLGFLVLASVVLGPYLALKVQRHLWPPLDDTEHLGVNDDLHFVEPELATWLADRPLISQRDVWNLSIAMSEQCDVARACSVNMPQWVYDHIVVAPLTALWLEKRDLVEALARPVGFALPALFAADDPEELEIDLADGRPRPRLSRPQFWHPA